MSEFNTLYPVGLRMNGAHWQGASHLSDDLGMLGVVLEDLLVHLLRSHSLGQEHTATSGSR